MAPAKQASGAATTKNEADRELFRHQFKKTRICSFFQEGRCRRGDECTFAHGMVDAPPDLTKTSLCKRWKAGNCTLSSDTCPFAHGKRELRQTPLFKNTRSNGNGEKTAPAGDTAVSKGPSGPRVPMPSKLQLMELTADSSIEAHYAEPLKPKAANKINSRKESTSPALFEPMKVTASFCADVAIDPLMPAFLALPPKMVTPWKGNELWEGETAAGESSSDDGFSPSASTTMEGLDSYMDLSPVSRKNMDLSPQADPYAAKVFAYSAFSGMPRVI